MVSPWAGKAVAVDDDAATNEERILLGSLVADLEPDGKGPQNDGRDGVSSPLHGTASRLGKMSPWPDGFEKRRVNRG